MEYEKARLLILAGGTGGHIFPALAVAKAAQAQGWACHWIGTDRGLEAETARQAEIPFSALTLQGLPRNRWWRYLQLGLQFLVALKQSYSILKQFRPTVVLSMGGYVTAAPALVARMCKVPLAVHEQNAVTGFTNRWIARIAQCTFSALRNTDLPHAKVVGNPLRGSLRKLAPPPIRFLKRRGPLRILVLGGSQGALAINKLIRECFTTYLDPKRYLLWHQTGPKHFKPTQQEYQQADYHPYRLEGFIVSMEKAYQWADLVISRSGAMTLSELATVGLGAFFIPYPHHLDRQQYKNAVPFLNHGAALLFEEKQLTAEQLAEQLSALTRSRLLRMAVRSRQLALNHATQEIIKNLALLHQPSTLKGANYA